MTTYYVGPGGNDSNAGTAWGTRFLTLSGAEAKPVAAGDTVYVGPGTYREMLTVGVSGSGGSPITYIGDYLGTNTDGVGGVVRITGSADDIALTRANCIRAENTRDYRTFQGFLMDGTSSHSVTFWNPCGHWIFNQCFFQGQKADGTNCLDIYGTGVSNTFQNCVFFGGAGNGIHIYHDTTVNNAGHLVQNCLFAGLAGNGLPISYVGGITIKNCTFVGIGGVGITIWNALAGGQTETVNNCIFQGCWTALNGTTPGEITEDYNDFNYCATNRTNVSTGTHSKTNLAMLDTRWFFNAVYTTAATKMISPFDLASDSTLLNVAGTSPSTTDLRGTTVQGAQREWGALEYDSTLKTKVAAYNPPVKNTQLILRVALEDMANPGSFKANPTIASGDFKVDIDGAGLANLGTLPTVSPSGSIWVLITLSAAEMNGSVISVQAIDQTNPKEWADLTFSIPTTQ